MTVHVWHCACCDRPVVFEGKIPLKCPHCYRVNWRCRKDPQRPFELNYNDKALLLRRLRISAE